MAEATTSPTEIAVARPLQPTLFLGKIAPLAVPEGDLLNYTLFFGNTGNDTARGVTVAIILPDQTEIFGTSPKVTQYDSHKHRAQWNIGDLPAHTAGAVILTVKVKQDSGTILENSAVINALNAVGQVAGPVTTTVSATSFFGRLHEGWNNAFGGLHINLGDAIKTNSFLQTDFKTIRPDSQFVATGNAPVIILKSVGFLIPLGPIAGVGQVLVGGRPGAITGGNELVTGLPMKLVSGSGNQIDVKDVGMASADNLGILLENIHGDHGTQLSEIGNVAIKGPGLVTNDGTMALNNDGQAPSVPLSIRKGAGLITDKGAGAVMAGAGSLIGNDGGTLIGNDGGTLIGNDGGTLTGTAGGALISASSGLISDKGNGLIGEKGSGLIGNDGGTFISHNGSAVTSK